MEVLVKKPTEEEIKEICTYPTWECGVSTFDWHYDSEETCYLLEGEVTLQYTGGNVSFSKGDYVILPKGLSCVWQVTKPVKKHYLFK